MTTVLADRLSAGETILALDDARIVGTVTFTRPEATGGSPFYDGPDVAGVGQFAVAPSHQRRGIGAILGGRVEQRAREIGARYLALDTSERAAGLIALYQSYGFQQVEHVQWQSVNYRSVVMAKPLIPDP
jgi:GNAT superfamily N-acetyltransferase